MVVWIGWAKRCITSVSERPQSLELRAVEERFLCRIQGVVLQNFSLVNCNATLVANLDGADYK